MAQLEADHAHQLAQAAGHQDTQQAILDGWPPDGDRTGLYLAWAPVWERLINALEQAEILADAIARYRYDAQQRALADGRPLPTTEEDLWRS